MTFIGGLSVGFGLSSIVTGVLPLWSSIALAVSGSIMVAARFAQLRNEKRERLRKFGLLP